jgi:hypothetical protein
MEAAHVSAKVTSTGAIELAEPLPDEFRLTDVDVYVAKRGPNGVKLDPWQVLALEAFFADDEDADDSVYDEL